MHELCNLLTQNELWTHDVIRALHTRGIWTKDQFVEKGDNVLDDIHTKLRECMDLASSSEETEHLLDKYKLIRSWQIFELRTILDHLMGRNAGVRGAFAAGGHGEYDMGTSQLCTLLRKLRDI